MLLVMLLVVSGAGPGCRKDTDCKGDRICEGGRCVSPQSIQPPPIVVQPPPTAPPVQREPQLTPTDPYADPFSQPVLPPEDVPSAPPLPGPTSAPATYPRVVRVNGQVCRETISAEGNLQRECVAETPRPSTRATRRREREAQRAKEPGATGVGDLTAQGGVLLAGTGALGVFGLSASGGVVFRPGVGVVGVAFANFSPSAFGLIQLYGIGPAVRFGSKSHVDLGIGPVLGIVPATTRAPTAVGLLTAIFARGALVLGEHFTLLAQPTLQFDPTGVVFTLTGGLGVAF